MIPKSALRAREQIDLKYENEHFEPQEEEVIPYSISEHVEIGCGRKFSGILLKFESRNFIILIFNQEYVEYMLTSATTAPSTVSNILANAIVIGSKDSFGLRRFSCRLLAARL